MRRRPRIDYRPYERPDGRYACTCGTVLVHRKSLCAHWVKFPAHHPVIEAPTEKACVQCDRTLPMEAFRAVAFMTWGRCSWCLDCERRKARERSRQRRQRAAASVRVLSGVRCRLCALDMALHGRCRRCEILVGPGHYETTMVGDVCGGCASEARQARQPARRERTAA